MGTTSTKDGVQYLTFDKEGSQHNNNNNLLQHRPNIPVSHDPQYALNLFTSATEAQGAIRGALGLRQTQTAQQSIARMGKILDDIENALAPK